MIFGISNIYAQQHSFVCKGIVFDSITMFPLQNVRIYYQDTIPVYSDKTGKFRISVKTGDNLHFRKAGYAWHTEKIINENMTVSLLKSDSSLYERLKLTYPREGTKIIYDDKLVPFDEWGDAFSTHPSEIVLIDANTTSPSKNTVIIKSIFQWNKR
jgi:hypothetical protein